MSLSQPRHFILSLVLSLLWPATAFAQTPADSPTTYPPQVQIKVNLVTISAAKLDRSGVTLDCMPLAQPGTFLQYAVGESATRLFRTLLHTRSKVVQVPLVTTSDNVKATIQAGVTITPRINKDDSITLRIASQAVNTNVGAPAAEPLGTMLRTIRSGNMIAVAGLPFSPAIPSSQKLLIFITPSSARTPRGATWGHYLLCKKHFQSLERQSP